ncbi:MAG: NAD-dependent epimerase/dehydratase family protein [Elusimicrobia bacterium]|jgi:dTDP-L-rhamnose 4-epimerase|nr:NAD-dependent epimerase/dehydratase family protein [Elusimicrobiota bacterium]
MEHILITGGAGFIGSRTAKALLGKGHRVRILDLLDPQIHGEKPKFPNSLNPGVDRIRGDVRRPADLQKALKGIDTVYHFAAKTGVGQSMYDVSGYVDTNVGGTATLLQAILQNKSQVKRLILASSRAVYGEGAALCPRHGNIFPEKRSRELLERGIFQVKCPHCGRTVKPIPTPEESRTDPGSIYALTKKHQEDLCLQAASAYGLSVVILRYFNVYGSGQALQNPYTGVATVFFNRLREGKPISLYEGGLPRRDFVHVSDVVQANLAALNPKIRSGSLFNVGSGQAITVRQLAQTLGNAIGRYPVLESKGEFRVGDIFACTAHMERSRHVLGYHPRMTLKKGLQEFATWANGEKRAKEGAYEQTVSELTHHNLFGKAAPPRKTKRKIRFSYTA